MNPMNKNLIMLLSGQLVSQIGDKFHMIALSLWVLNTTGSTAKMGAVLAASLIPGLLLGFFSGAIVDRFNRKYIIVGTDIFRGVLLAVFALLFFNEKMSFSTVLVMQALLSVNAAFFDPAVPSLIPVIVKRDQLAGANSMYQFINGISMIAGAFLSGIFISFFGYLWVFVVNAASFLISGLFECFIKTPEEQLERKDFSLKNVMTDLSSGYRYMLSRQVLMILLFMVMLIHFFVGSIEVFMPVLAGLFDTGPEKNLGYFHAVFGAGSIIMGLLGKYIVRPGVEKYTLFTSTCVMGVLLSGMSLLNAGQTTAIAGYLVVFFLFGSTVICAGVSFRTLLQKSIDNRFAGRVFAVAGSLGNGSIPAAMIIYGMLLEKYRPQGLLMISGLVLIGLSIISLTLYREEKNGEQQSAGSKRAQEN